MATATPTPINPNQLAYLTNLSKTGSAGNQAWAKSQLGSTPVPQQGTPAPTPTSNIPNYESQSKPPQNMGIPMSSIGTKLATTPVPVQQGVSNAVKTAGQATGGTLPSQQTPTPTSNWSSTPDQARQSASEQAAIRIKELLQGGQNAYNTGTTSENAAFKYGNDTTKGNRVLRDATNYAKSDPFQGSTMENNYRIQRDDGINDTYTNDQHQNKLNSISQTWQDLQTAAPEKQQALYDQLYQQAAALGIQADQLNAQLQNNQFNQGIAQAGVTGQYTNPTTGQTQQTIQGQTAQLNNQGQAQQNLLNQYKIDSYPAESKAAAEKIKNDAAIGQLDLATAQFKLKELQDPNSPTNQAAKLDLQIKQIDAKYADPTAKAKLQELQKQTAQIGKAPYKSADEKAYDAQQVIKIKAEIAKIEAGSTPKPAVIDPKASTDAYTHYKDQIDNSTYSKEQKLAFAASIKDELTASDYAKLVGGIQ